jgi:NAD(P)-dependent dehydrogenase (short-subunit alcohol dehydrogenase family)
MTVTLITGAASGIGEAVTLRLAALRDARLLLSDLSEDRLRSVKRKAETLGARTLAVAGDISDIAVPERLVAEAGRMFGRLDGIVSNAGALCGGLLKDLAIEDYERQFAIHTRPTWLLGKAAYAMLSASRGAIVATASMSSMLATPPLGAYSASKAALAMLIEQMAIEWGPVGIRCNCVSPGPTLTPMNAAGYADASRRQQREAVIPLRRLGAPGDIAAAIAFLLSPDASFINGVNLMVDGGLSRNLMPATGAGTGQTAKG